MPNYDTLRSIEGAKVHQIRQEMVRLGLIGDSSNWVQLTGGRTNTVWRIAQPNHPTLVCKAYDPDAGSILFPNDAPMEARALRHLAKANLAPLLLGTFTAAGTQCLVYRHVSGNRWAKNVALVAGVLARLHRTQPPKLRRIPSGSEALISQTRMIIDQCTTKLADRVATMQPNSPNIARIEPVFIHGDLVPANIVCNNSGVTLIDWQCPGIGDPCEDLAVFLSPAMQTLYGDGVLSREDETEFLNCYGDSAMAARYRVLSPLFHWRMAAHCARKAEAGAAGYAEVVNMELEALVQSSNPR